MSNKPFGKLYKHVALDPRLEGTTFNLFCILLTLAGKSRKISIKIKELAERLNRKPCTVRVHLNKLIALGYIERILRKSKYDPKQNIASLFIVHPEGALTQGDLPTHNDLERKIIVGTLKNQCQKNLDIRDIDSLRTTLKGEAETSQTIGNIPTISEEKYETIEVQDEKVSEAPKAPESTRKSQVEEEPSIKADLMGVPDIMIPTARYWLQRTGHTTLTDKDIAALVELSQTQYPTYVNKEIDVAVERFTRLGRDFSTLHMGYIVTCMAGKRTYNPDVKPPTRHKRAARKAAKAQVVQEVVSHVSVEQEAIVEADAVKIAAPVEVSEPVVPAEPLAMPVEEAERVIAEHEAERPVQVELPPALVKLHKAIEAKNQEVIDERLEKFPKDENGDPILSDDEFEEIVLGGIGVEDYLRVKFPDTTDEELSTEHLNPSDQSALEQAMQIDKACALCCKGASCSLPEGCDKTHSRPVAMLKPDLLGRKRVVIGYGGCVRCKHDCAACKSDPEFERKVKVCGLSPKQKEQTFATYDHAAAGAEAIVAKAMAILAAKNKRNLVLAGRAGTGKTHLAIAIAIEAMKAGQQAIVKSVPDLMDELISANRNNTDPFGVMLKYKTVPCLVLDDLGKQTNTEAVWKYLYQLVDYRYQYGLQTIVTTNAYDMEGLKRKWNEDKVEPVMSRVLENGDWVTISEAENYRLKRHSRVCEEEKIADQPAPVEALAEPKPEEAESVLADVVESELVEPEQELNEYVDEQCDSCEAENTPTSEVGNEPPSRPKHYTEEEWYRNLTDVDKALVQKARYLEYLEEQSRKKPESPTPKPTPEEQEREKAKIDAWLDEQCEAAEMTDEEIDAMVDEAMKADVPANAPAEKPEAPQTGGTVINVPHYDDGLDDDEEEDLRLYGGLYSK